MTATVADIDALLRTRDWKFSEMPVSQHVLEAARERMNWNLPQGLINLYQLGDRGEGSLRNQPWNFVLWGIQNVADLRNHVHYQSYYPDFLFFGGNGAGEYFGLDRQGQVFFMDPIAGEDSIIVSSKSMDEFIANLGLAPVGLDGPR